MQFFSRGARKILLREISPGINLYDISFWRRG